jgi:hypothetical protein
VNPENWPSAEEDTRIPAQRKQIRRIKYIV